MRLKELRQEKGLTQAEVAKSVKTSQRNIGRWENGENEPTASFIAKLAEFFQVSTDYLLGLEDDFGVKVETDEALLYSAEEKKLIEDYRKLNSDKRELIKSNIKAMLPNGKAEK